VNNTVYFITSKSRYILALLNSSLINYYYRLIANTLGAKGIRYFTQFVERIPIKKISEDEQKPFVDIVGKILTITKGEDCLQNPAKQAKVKEYERQIDQMVYKLYGLTEAEIKIVEDFKQ